MPAPKTKLSLNVQHDYITLRTPNGNFTMGRGGLRASGLLARNAAAFKALTDYVTRVRTAGTKNGAIMAALANPAVLSALWPDWNAESTLPDFKVGDAVRVGATILAKKYPGDYEVAEVKRTTVYVKLPSGGLMGFSKIDLVKTLKPTPHL